MSTTRGIALVLLLAVAATCKPDDQRTDTMDVEKALHQEREHLPVEVVAGIDSGSAAFRARDYEAALGYYTRAAEMEPGLAAAWFGIYMAQKALGNIEAAEEALNRVRSVEPEATLVHPSPPDANR